VPAGSLDLQLTDMAGAPVRDIYVELTRKAGELGTGAQTAHVSLAGPDTDLTITGIACRSGLGSMYRVLAMTPHYRPYSFFQLIHEDRVNTAADDVEFWVKPGDVADVRAPAFDDLPARGRRILEEAEMIALKPEDRDLEQLNGADLYRAFGPLRKACFLNLLAKMAHTATTGNCLALIGGLVLCRQDRLFAFVDDDLPERLRQSPLFKSAPETLRPRRGKAG
jgi:hypothetical protein